MFSSGFVVYVMVNGEVQSESRQGIVRVPFGSEYSIGLRNKSKRDAVAKIYIDGENVSADGFIVRSGGRVEIERPVDVSRKFRFVASDSDEAIVAGKNNQPDDRNGVIEVKWWKEAVVKREPIQYRPRTFEKEVPTSGILRSCSFDDEGCTVEGSISGQRFSVGNIGELENEFVVVRLVMQGYEMSSIVKTARFCTSCGSAIEARHRFCSVCGKRI